MADEPSLPLAPSLRQLTPARVALGRAGTSVSTHHHLAFQLDHAAARDAVHMHLDIPSFLDACAQRDWPALAVHSAATAAGDHDRRTYLQRPDLGRRLSPGSAQAAREFAATLATRPEIVFVIADGLSALAVERNALPLLDVLAPLLPAHAWSGPAPVCVVRNGRVAIGDEVGEILGASLVAVLIGERPGLSAADSLGVYLTWSPRVGTTDAERDCISNVRDGGLSHAEAAARLLARMSRARMLQGSGVAALGRSELPTNSASQAPATAL